MSEQMSQTSESMRRAFEASLPEEGVKSSRQSRWTSSARRKIAVLRL